jgi:hypothetical protein
MYKFHLLIISIIILTTSCRKENSYQNASSFSFSDFGNSTLLHGTDMTFDDLLMRPVDFRVIDSLLVMRNRGTEYQFHIFNTQNTKKIGELIPFGNGPNEMIEPAIIPSDDSFIWILDKMKRSVSKCSLNISTDTSYIEILKKITIQEYADQAAIINKNILAVILNPAMKRFCLYDNTGLLIKDFGEYPECKSDYAEYEKMEAFFCDFIINHKKNRLLMSYKQTDLIDIYDLEGNLIKRLHGPEQFYPAVKQEQNGEQIKVRAQSGKSRHAYFTPRNAGEEVFILYSGKVFDKERPSYLMNNIFVFDWDGNPIRRYELDNPCFSFDVDPKNKTIYTLSDNPDFHITKYNY